jgi:3-methylfumaryl-CoA hydratase
MNESKQKYTDRRIEYHDLITAAQVQKLNATLDRDEPVPGEGDPVPPGWHPIYFPKLPPTRELGRDGMIKEIEDWQGEAPLPIRMFAGSRTRFVRPLRIGERARRVSELVSMTPKEGRSGRLMFATYRHTISAADAVCIVDEWDMVFREEVKGDAKAAPPGQSAPSGFKWEKTVIPTSVMLFRFSAVTFNPHRIHYDHPYTTGTEGYPKLLVHGPLTAILLTDLARDSNPGATMTGFDMRAKAPLYADEPFRIAGRPRQGGKACDLWAITPQNTVAMEAVATFA